MAIDLNIVYIIVILIVAVGLIFGANYLRKKGLISESDLEFASKLLGLTVSIVNELNLQNEDKIKNISNFIILGLNEVNSTMALTDKQQIIDNVKNYVYKACEQANIELTDNRKNIINSLVEIAVNNKYGDELVK